MSSWRSEVILGTRDVKRAVEYYCDVLAFERVNVFEPTADEGAVYGIVRRDDIAVHLQIRRREIWAGERESIESDVYFYVADADSLLDELKGRGARILREPMDEDYGLRDFVVEDLDGHRLVFGSPLATS